MHETRTTSSRYDPWDHADQLGIGVVWGGTQGHLGLWDGHTIHLAEDLTTREVPCVLGHELVHAEYQDEPTTDPHWSAKREARCDRIAARRLIDPHQLHDLLATTTDLGYIAVELGVTGWLLEAYLKDHHAAHPRPMAS